MAEGTHLRIAAHIPKHPFWAVVTCMIDSLVGVNGVLDSGSTVMVRTPRFRMGDLDNLLAVRAGEAEIGITTPVNAGFMAMNGLGPFKAPFTEIRGLAVVPHLDYFNWALDKETRITSFEEIREKRVGLKIATGRKAGIGPDLRSFTASEVLRHHGITEEELKQWGGGFDHIGEPENAIAAVLSHRADGVFHEGQFLPGWIKLTNSMPITFLSLDEKAVASICQEYRFEEFRVPANRYKGLDVDTLTLDFGGFLIFTSSAMQSGVASKVAEAIVLSLPKIEEAFSKFPPEHRPVQTPISAATLCKGLKIPLHPGAEEYYGRAGYL